MPCSPDGRAPLCHSILSHFSPRTCSASKYMFNPSLETVWKIGFQVLALVDNIYPFRHAVLLDLGLCKNSGTSRAMKTASETTAGLAMSEGGGIWAEKKKKTHSRPVLGASLSYISQAMVGESNCWVIEKVLGASLMEIIQIEHRLSHQRQRKAEGRHGVKTRWSKPRTEWSDL